MPRNPRADKSISRLIRKFTPQNTDRGRSLPPVCAGVQARLTRYMDGELNARERERLQGHLDVCAACREELRQFAHAEQMLAGARQAVPSPGDLRVGFYARLNAEPAKTRISINWRIAAPAFAACGLLLAFGASTYLHHAAPGTSAAPNDLALANRIKPQNALQTRGRDIAFGRPAVPRALPPSLVPAPQKRSVAVAVPAQAGEVDFAENSSLLSAQARAWNHRPQRAQSMLHSFKPRGTGYAVAAISAARLPALSSVVRPARPNLARVQVALLSKRAVYGWRGEEAYVSLSAAPRKFGLNAMGRSQQDSNSLAYRPAPLGHEALPERAKSKDTYFMYDYRGDGKREQEIAGVRLRADTFALALTPADTGDIVGAGFGEAPAGADGVSFRVRDTRRGFVSGTRVASEVQQRDGRQVLSIRMEDEDTRTSEAGDMGGETSGKTGNQE